MTAQDRATQPTRIDPKLLEILVCPLTKTRLGAVCTAKVNGLRKPTAQMARLAPLGLPVTPGKVEGLSAGMVPSALMRSSLPFIVASDWALFGSWLSPTVM